MVFRLFMVPEKDAFLLAILNKDIASHSLFLVREHLRFSRHLK